MSHRTPCIRWRDPPPPRRSLSKMTLPLGCQLWKWDIHTEEREPQPRSLTSTANGTKLEGKQDLEILQPSTLFKHLESEQPSMEEHSQCPQLPWLCGWVEMPLHLVSPPGAPQTQQILVVAAATKPCGATGLSPRVTSSCTRALQGLVWPPSLLENDISVLLAAF